ncbi:MAG TPA: hypothetical protein VGM31_14585, partial [Puia sp.]
MSKKERRCPKGHTKEQGAGRPKQPVFRWNEGGKNIFPSLNWKGSGRGIRGRMGLLKTVMLVVLGVIMGSDTRAQLPGIDIVGEIAKRVVEAIDLKVQQAQEATMELQVAQREL